MLPSPPKSTDAGSLPNRAERLAALLAALAMIAFAWSGYQSAEWVRERFTHSDDARLSEESLEISAEADRNEEQDAILYVEWRVALNAGDDDTADIIFGLFRPQLQEYVLSAPRDDQGRPLAPPFDDPGYDVVQARSEANDLDVESDEQDALAGTASGNGARYGGLGFLFAAVIAAVGIASRFTDRRIRRGLIVLAGVMLAVGFVLLVVSPLSFSAP